MTSSTIGFRAPARPVTARASLRKIGLVSTPCTSNTSSRHCTFTHRRCVNVQWRDDVFEVQGVETRPILRRDARAVTGRAGARKPIVLDVMDALCEAAVEKRCPYFPHPHPHPPLP